ncbi:MAG TPA: DUF433 domain-containing protein [Candidatus Bipolaricaulis anaerobius]|nr:DUF433 domain-containing protein [Candidatus Bipolaricaulis anaerobius]HNS23711.1 DUF433 domain-containing protein [Candidatus Bipolaricaulis anaerobius]
MVVETKYPHVVIDEHGVPMLKGTTLKVVELVVEKLAYGWSPGELHFQHPDLTLGQIHAALAYCRDHARELDQDIVERLRKVEELRNAAQREPSPLSKPKAKGLL